jgi:CelD/BcsL family acetyltransferase involved in cellulose biosynthesis
MRSVQAVATGCLNAETRYSVEAVTKESEIATLAPDWDRLCREVDDPNAFMTPGWFRAWTKHHKDQQRNVYSPRVVVFREEGILVGIAPLVMRIVSRWLGLRKLEFSTIHADYNNFIVGKDQAGLTRAFVQFLSRTSRDWDLLDLRDLRGSEEEIRRIEKALTDAGLSFHRTSEKSGCPYLPIDGDAAHVMKRLSGHERRVLRKRMERAASEGLTIRIIEHPERESGLIDKLATLDHHRTLSREYPPFLGSYPEVFRALFDDLGPRGWIYISLVEQGERAIAYQVGFFCGKKLWDYTKAYDRDYFRFAPGTAMLPSLLDLGHERGFIEYDFLRGEEPYKMVWSTGCHQRFRLLIWNRRRTSRFRKFVYHDVKTTIYRLLHKHI